MAHDLTCSPVAFSHASLTLPYVPSPKVRMSSKRFLRLCLCGWMSALPEPPLLRLTGGLLALADPTQAALDGPRGLDPFLVSEVGSEADAVPLQVTFSLAGILLLWNTIKAN
jgi:hypothetical protein